MKKQTPEKADANQTSNVHVRFSQKDIALLDCCAKLHGVSRSAYVRNLVLAHIADELGDLSVSNTEKIVRKTLETILDIKTKKEAQTLRSLVSEIQRANFMQLKSYIELHPGQDLSEYKAYYYQSKQEAFEVSSGRKSFSAMVPENEVVSGSANEPVPDWLKIIAGDNDSKKETDDA